MAYTLGNKCAKNLCKWIVLLQLIIENVVTCFLFWNTVYIDNYSKSKLGAEYVKIYLFFSAHSRTNRYSASYNEKPNNILLNTAVSRKACQLWQAVSCNVYKHGLILIILCRQRQHTIKSDVRIQFSLSLHFYLL